MQISQKSQGQSQSDKQADQIATKFGKQSHKIELDRLHGMSVTAVVDVPVFTDKSITIRLIDETLSISGNNLCVKSLDTEGGLLVVNGQINQLKYSSQASPSSLAKRIFK